MLIRILTKMKMWFMSVFKKHQAIDLVEKKQNKIIVGFLEVETENITQKGLRIVQGEEAELLVLKSFENTVHKDDPSKRTVAFKSFTYKKGGTMERLGIRSSVEFHFEADLWVPWKLELQMDMDPPKTFLCDVTREPKGFRYSYKVKKIPTGK